MPNELARALSRDLGDRGVFGLLKELRTMPPKPKPVAPDHRAPMADHKKHAQEVLEYEEYKKKPAGYQDKNDEAKP